jgi:hypothetical protein
MFGSVTSPKRQRVSTLRLIHSLARRACTLNGSSEHGAVQLSRIPIARPPQGREVTVRAGKTSCCISKPSFEGSINERRPLNRQ